MFRYWIKCTELHFVVMQHYAIRRIKILLLIFGTLRWLWDDSQYAYCRLIVGNEHVEVSAHAKRMRVIDLRLLSKEWDFCASEHRKYCTHWRVWCTACAWHSYADYLSRTQFWLRKNGLQIIPIYHIWHRLVLYNSFSAGTYFLPRAVASMVVHMTCAIHNYFFSLD